MGREWKPGDVGKSHYGRVMFMGGGEHGGELEAGWYFDDGSGPECAEDLLDFTPLVVIDPEDRGQVERLVEAYYGAKGDAKQSMQAALRSLIAPPKPDEPQGLGAVVEDDGRRWTRTRSHEHGNNWREECGGRWRTWAEFDAVRVLSEGVQ